jgi:hypothetical protein
MKSVELFRTFDYHPHARLTVRFAEGVIYTRVLEAAAKAIERAGAGRIVELGGDGAAGDYQHTIIDASHAWRRRG